jgi:hypothetical protein
MAKGKKIKPIASVSISKIKPIIDVQSGINIPGGGVGPRACEQCIDPGHQQFPECDRVRAGDYMNVMKSKVNLGSKLGSKLNKAGKFSK